MYKYNDCNKYDTVMLGYAIFRVQISKHRA